MRLESSIKELHDMFMDIAVLVENQVAQWVPRGQGGEEARGFLRRARRDSWKAGWGGKIGRAHV